ncbi:unnamed protein product, partial [Callosobruchus maculatus]
MIKCSDKWFIRVIYVRIVLINLSMMIFLSRDIDYEGFHKFIDTFLEVRTPEELCRHLFLSFMKRSEPKNIEGKAFKEMTVLSSTTACAPVTSHNKG